MSPHPINIYQVPVKCSLFQSSFLFCVGNSQHFSPSPSIVWLIESTGTHFVCLERVLSVSLSLQQLLFDDLLNRSGERASRRIDAIAVARLNLATCIPALSLSLYLFAIETFPWEIVLKQIRILKIRIERRLANISFYSILYSEAV